ncbi:response regulator [Deltaproteobacteria bacterium TL4]
MAMRILIVDDEQHIQNMIKHFLLLKGHEVHIAANGQQAWEIFKEKEDGFDLILTDIKMPVMTGVQLLQKIRNKGHDVPIIIMTAYAEMDYTLTALRLGAFDFLIKPFPLEELAKSLAKLESLQTQKLELEDVIPYYRGRMEFEIPSNTNLINGTVSLLQNLYRDLCEAYHLDSNQIRIALLEAMMNAVTHGNLEVSSNLKEDDWESFDKMVVERGLQPEYSSRKVHIEAEVTEDSIIFEFEDQGKGFNTKNTPSFDDPLSLATSGRGILLIKSFMDEVQWNEKGNHITMIKRLPKLEVSQA